MSNRPMIRFLVVALGFVVALPVLAHGEKPHEAVRVFDPATAEQKAIGIAADPRLAKRTIRIDMSDAMRFTPAELRVRRGEIVRFVVANRGKLLHELVLGTKAELEAHAELMRKHPGMEHDEPHMVHVAAGKQGEIGWRFTEAGTFYFGCLIPGHFESGMVGRITVVP